MNGRRVLAAEMEENDQILFDNLKCRLVSRIKDIHCFSKDYIPP